MIQPLDINLYKLDKLQQCSSFSIHCVSETNSRRGYKEKAIFKVAKAFKISSYHNDI